MDAERLLRHKLRNRLQSLLLVTSMALLCAYLAWLIGGESFAWIALGFVIAAYIANPVASPRLIMSMYRGHALTPQEAPNLYAILRELADRAGLKRLPTLYYVPSRPMNAFAAGDRDDAAIAVSDGLLRNLDARQLAAVLAHELSHVRHGDTRVMAFADLTSRVTSLLSVAGQLLLFVNLPLLVFGQYGLPWMPILVLLAAPTVSALVQLALSRNREYEADRGAVELTGDPQALASALRRMESYQGRVLERILMPGQRIPDPSLLRTHPPTAERIRRLQDMHVPRPGSPYILPETARPSSLPVAQPLRPRWHRSGLWY